MGTCCEHLENWKAKGNNLSLLPHSLLHGSGYECPSSVTLARSQGDTAPRPTLPLWFTGEKHCLPNWLYFFFPLVLFEKTQLCWNLIRGWEKWCFSSFSPLTCSIPRQNSARSAKAWWVPHTHLWDDHTGKMFVQSSQKIVEKWVLLFILFRCSRFTANLFVVKQSKRASAFWNPETWWKLGSLQMGMMMVWESQVSWSCQLVSGCKGKHQWAVLTVSSPRSFASFGY